MVKRLAVFMYNISVCLNSSITINEEFLNMLIIFFEDYYDSNQKEINMLLGIIISYVFIAIIILTAKLFEKMGKEAERKYIHIALCNWWIIAMYFFDSVLWASIVPLSFVGINYISYKKNLISVMEREEQDGLGTVYYAASLLILAIICFGIIKNSITILMPWSMPLPYPSALRLQKIWPMYFPAA